MAQNFPPLCWVNGFRSFRRYFGQNKEIVSVFNGSVVYFNVGIGLTFYGRGCSTRHELYFQLFVEMILAVGCR
jgi:hypothetical protein